MNGDSIRNFRESLGLSQVALAEDAGINRTTLAQIEGGTGDPVWSSIRSVQDALRRRGAVLGYDLDDPDPEQLVAARILVGLTSTQLAEILGLARQTIVHIENRTGNIRLSKVRAYVSYFQGRGIHFTADCGIVGRRPNTHDPAAAASSGEQSLPPRASQ